MNKHNLIQRLPNLICTLVLLLSVFPSAALAAEGESMNDRAYFWNGSILVDGSDVYFAKDNVGYDPISYDGNVYIPAFAVGEWNAADVRWDQEAEQITVLRDPKLSSYYRGANEQMSRTDEEFEVWREKWENGLKNGFEVTVLTGTQVIGDQGAVVTTTQGRELHPILFEGTPYLPVRTAAQLSGRTQLYLDYLFQWRPTILIYERPTREEVHDTRLYLNEVDVRLKNVWEDLIHVENAQDKAALYNALAHTKELLLKVKEPTLPPIRTLSVRAQSDLFRYGVDGDNGVSSMEEDMAWCLDSGSRIYDPYGLKSLERVRQSQSWGLRNEVYRLREQVMRMRQMTDAIAAGELSG